MSCRRFILPLTLLTALTVTACGDPPDKEIQQARGAIDAARAVGADQYATEEFEAAQRALASANEAVVQRDYRLALNNALDARDRAQTAARQAADAKAKARVEADRAVTEAATSVAEAVARLKAAESARAAPRVLTELRRAIAGAEQALQEARADLERGAYLSATESAKSATSRLQPVAAARDTRPAAGSRRRR